MTVRRTIMRALVLSPLFIHAHAALATGSLDNIQKPGETDVSAPPPQPIPQPQPIPIPMPNPMPNPGPNPMPNPNPVQLPPVPSSGGVMAFGASLVSNMESGFHIMDHGYKAACIDPQGVVAIARMDIYAAVNGEITDADSPYTPVTLRPALEFVRPGATSGQCQLKVCLPASGSTPGQDFRCDQVATNGVGLGLKLGGDSERPTTYQENNVPYVVNGPDIKLQTKYATVSAFHPVYGFAAPAKSFKDYQSPLVLDMSGRGTFDLVDVWDGKVDIRFDLVGDGAPVRTGWVRPTGAFLALDPSHKGKIDSGLKLFGQYTPGATKRGDGTTYENGFLALAQFDVQHKGVIDAKSPVFKDLVIWRDLNQNGNADKGEVMSLADAGIESISLAYKENRVGGHFQKISGNEVRYVSTFKMKDGRTGVIADIWFRQRRFADRPLASTEPKH